MPELNNGQPLDDDQQAFINRLGRLGANDQQVPEDYINNARSGTDNFDALQNRLRETRLELFPDDPSLDTRIGEALAPARAKLADALLKAIPTSSYDNAEEIKNAAEVARRNAVAGGRPNDAALAAEIQTAEKDAATRIVNRYRSGEFISHNTNAEEELTRIRGFADLAETPLNAADAEKIAGRIRECNAEVAQRMLNDLKGSAARKPPAIPNMDGPQGIAKQGEEIAAHLRASGRTDEAAYRAEINEAMGKANFAEANHALQTWESGGGAPARSTMRSATNIETQLAEARRQLAADGMEQAEIDKMIPMKAFQDRLKAMEPKFNPSVQETAAPEMQPNPAQQQQRLPHTTDADKATQARQAQDQIANQARRTAQGTSSAAQATDTPHPAATTPEIPAARAPAAPSTAAVSEGAAAAGRTGALATALDAARFVGRLGGAAVIPAALVIEAHDVTAKNNAERTAAGEISQTELRDALTGKPASDPAIRKYVEDQILGKQYDTVNASSGLDPESRKRDRAQYIAQGIHRILESNSGDEHTPNDLHLMRNPDKSLGVSNLGNATGEVLKQAALDIIMINPAMAIYHYFAGPGTDAGKNGSTPQPPASTPGADTSHATATRGS